MSGAKGRSGGTRVGAGRRPQDAQARWLGGNAGKRDEPAVKGPQVAVVPVERPADLPNDQQLVWEALAPHASGLTPATAIAFRDLCEAIVIKRLMLAQIQADGLTSNRVTLQMDEAGGGLQAVEPKAHPLLSKWTALMVRVEAGMSRFRLTADGKPTAPAEEPKDEWSEFDAGPRLVKGA